jgi:hypothetical protein
VAADMMDSSGEFRGSCADSVKPAEKGLEPFPGIQETGSRSFEQGGYSDAEHSSRSLESRP